MMIMWRQWRSVDATLCDACNVDSPLSLEMSLDVKILIDAERRLPGKNNSAQEPQCTCARPDELCTEFQQEPKLCYP